jgi:membrane protease YdiL (CAAX protease family)
VEFLILLALQIGIVALFHFRLVEYPEPLPLDENRRRTIWETLIFWALTQIILAAILFSGFADPIIEGDPTPALLLQFISITAVGYILVPVFYLVRVKKWTLRDFGFRGPVPNSQAIIVVALIVFGIAGALPLLDAGFAPGPILLLIAALWQPAFIEEFFFRGVIQGNLERAIGQNKAWIFGGILFGLAHVTVNYFAAGLDLVPGIFQLIDQTVAGWIFGILYMKTRSLYPGMFVHFLTDGRLAETIAWIS